VELNLEPSDALVPFDEVRVGPASSVVPGWVEERIAIQAP
jgi:NAD-dependent deacetylase